MHRSMPGPKKQSKSTPAIQASPQVTDQGLGTNVHRMLHLQRAIGNHALVREIRRGTAITGTAVKPVAICATPTGYTILQRETVLYPFEDVLGTDTDHDSIAYNFAHYTDPLKIPLPHYQRKPLGDVVHEIAADFAYENNLNSVQRVQKEAEIVDKSRQHTDRINNILVTNAGNPLATFSAALKGAYQGLDRYLDGVFAQIFKTYRGRSNQKDYTIIRSTEIPSRTNIESQHAYQNSKNELPRIKGSSYTTYDLKDAQNPNRRGTLRLVVAYNPRGDAVIGFRTLDHYNSFQRVVGTVDIGGTKVTLPATYSPNAVE
ncbi:MAG: ribonuclease domain-containing protein [bacterium]|nr:ribonuclease domain-containing protein [bacterium]